MSAHKSRIEFVHHFKLYGSIISSEDDITYMFAEREIVSMRSALIGNVHDGK